MKIDFTRMVKHRKDHDALLQGTPITLHEAVVESLNHINPQVNLTAQQKLLRGRLINRLDQGEIEFKVEDVSEMKLAVEQCFWTPVVMVNIQNMLEETTSLSLVPEVREA